MRIAFVSYEFPPDAAYGGIATYVYQASKMLAEHGHQVEVFTSSPTRSSVSEERGVLVHRLMEPSHERFPDRVADVFLARHQTYAFDVLEGPEYGADALPTVKRVPDIPLVVKLHTPSFQLTACTYDGLGFADPLKWRLLAGRSRLYVNRWIDGSSPRWKYTHKYDLDAERRHALQADEVASPSRSLAEIAAAAWRLDVSRIAHVPYPYVPSTRILNIDAGSKSSVVTFIGRLEVRKGVMDLAKAIPQVLARYPEALFRFIGPDDESPRANMGMKRYLARMLQTHQRSVDFLPPVPNHELPTILADAKICVFPSIWENFANVCLEAMAAARAVIASEAGGMAEMLDGGRVGLIVPPHAPRDLAKAIMELLDSPGRRRSMGIAARQRLLEEYNQDRVYELQIQSYQRAISHRNRVGTRAD